jgi:hypothetical protein
MRHRLGSAAVPLTEVQQQQALDLRQDLLVAELRCR